MTDKIRLFVAVTPPPEHLEWLQGATRHLRLRWPDARWASIENQHVTLKFLGWTDVERVDAVHEVVATVCRGDRAASARLEGLGVFPSERRARVLWAGLTGDEGLLARLAGAFDAAFAHFGWEPEKRGFSPHLTLARFKQPVRADDLGDLRGGGPGSFPLEAVHLYESRLHPSGARYRMVATQYLSTV